MRLKDTDFTEDDLLLLTEDNRTLWKAYRMSGYFISYDNLFSTWVKRATIFEISNVRDALSAFSATSIRHVRECSTVFSTPCRPDFPSLAPMRASQGRARPDLSHWDIPMDSRQDYDVLGFIYEYLISNFAANAGKKAGEFYTPSEVSPADERNRRMAFAGARADPRSTIQHPVPALC